MYLCPEPLDQGRFANTSLTADEDDLPQPGFALVPAVAQQPTFLFPSHKHWHCSSKKFLVTAGCCYQATHTADRHRLRNPVECVRPEVFEGKGALYQTCRHGANHHHVGRGEGLEPRRNVGRFPEHQVLGPPTTAYHPHHDRASMNAEPHGELHTVLCRQTGIQGRDGLDNAQAGVHRTPGLVFMRCRVAKVDQQPIAEVLRDVAGVVLNNLGRGLLVSTHHRTQVFRIKLTGELRGTRQVTEQHRELPPFGIDWRCDDCGLGYRGGLVVVGNELGSRARGARPSPVHTSIRPSWSLANWRTSMISTFKSSMYASSSSKRRFRAWYERRCSSTSKPHDLR